MRKQTILALLLCLIVTFAMSGCVKVVEIGKEDELTGNKKFNAAENVEGLWSSQAVPELTGKTVDLAAVLNESGVDFAKVADKYGHYSMGTGGELFMGNEKVHFNNVSDARAHGIGIIHQELSLFPNLNVYQNIFMAREKTKNKIGLDNAQHVELTKKILARLEHPIDPYTIIGDLRVGQQQMIEIARNLIANDLKSLIMDEPTSSLSEQEVQVLFKIMRELIADGISIVYISHRLEEIMQIGD